MLLQNSVAVPVKAEILAFSSSIFFVSVNRWLRIPISNGLSYCLSYQVRSVASVFEKLTIGLFVPLHSLLVVLLQKNIDKSVRSQYKFCWYLRRSCFTTTFDENRPRVFAFPNFTITGKTCPFCETSLRSRIVPWCARRTLHLGFGSWSHRLDRGSSWIARCTENGSVLVSRSLRDNEVHKKYRGPENLIKRPKISRSFRDIKFQKIYRD